MTDISREPRPDAKQTQNPVMENSLSHILQFHFKL